MTTKPKLPEERNPYLVWKGEEIWIAKDTETSVTSQGDNPEEALKNLQEALELYYEDSGVPEEDLESVEIP